MMLEVGASNGNTWAVNTDCSKKVTKDRRQDPNGAGSERGLKEGAATTKECAGGIGTAPGTKH